MIVEDVVLEGADERRFVKAQRNFVMPMDAGLSGCCAAGFKMARPIFFRDTGDRHIPKGGCGDRWDLVDLI